jgi:hypothetical protein
MRGRSLLLDLGTILWSREIFVPVATPRPVVRL